MVGFRGFMRIATRQIHWHRLTVGEGNVPFYSHLAVVSSTSRKTGIVLTSHTDYATIFEKLLLFFKYILKGWVAYIPDTEDVGVLRSLNKKS